ncbi:MAG: hypothetical protein KKD44_10590 [Proteobacteria bacterium]|nr:hypothetical protein [Pseudomonadota bacterium]
MEQVFESKIDSEKIIHSWIDNATRIWDSLVQKDGDKKSSFFNDEDSAKKAYQAWEPALKTWNEFTGSINKKEMIDSLVEGNKAGVENFHKIMKSGLEGYSFFQKRWMESASNINDVFKNHKGSSFGGSEIFDVFADIYKKEFSKFLSVPPLGLSRQYQTKLQQVIDKSNIFQVKFLEFLYFLYIPFEKSFKVVQDSLASLADEGNLPDDTKEYYKMWLKQLENHYMALFKSSEYTNALGKVVDAMSDFLSARQQITQDTFKAFGVPVEKDMDELYKDIYSLKKRIRLLEKDAQKK